MSKSDSKIPKVKFTEPERAPYLVKPDMLLEATWVTEVFQRFNNKCGNCGATERLTVRMIVPLEVGGQEVATNGVLLCRICDIVSGLTPKPGAVSFSRPFNFYVSQSLFEFITERGKVNRGVADFLRQMIDTYLGDPLRYDDILQYQDSDSAVKINFHLPSEQFDRLRAHAVAMGSNVTEVLRGLLLWLQDQKGSKSNV